MSNEENKAIEYLKRHIMPYENEDGNIEFLINDVLLNLVDKQQKEINFYKNEELGYIAGYEDGKRHKQTAVMIKKENTQQELFEKEIVRLKKIIEKQQKEIEELKLELINQGIADLKELNNYIRKDKIKEIISNKRKKVLEKHDSKLSIVKRIYKRNIQVAMLDTLLKELLEE